MTRALITSSLDNHSSLPYAVIPHIALLEKWGPHRQWQPCLNTCRRFMVQPSLLISIFLTTVCPRSGEDFSRGIGLWRERYFLNQMAISIQFFFCKENFALSGTRFLEQTPFHLKKAILYKMCLVIAWLYDASDGLDVVIELACDACRNSNRSQCTY